MVVRKETELGRSSRHFLPQIFYLDFAPLLLNFTLRLSPLFAFTVSATFSVPVIGAEPTVEHVTVYHHKGRFGGWPANHGIWSWGNEILVGFSAGYHEDRGPEFHNIDHDKPEEHLLARSKDGGQTWSIENPAEQHVL